MRSRLELSGSNSTRGHQSGIPRPSSRTYPALRDIFGCSSDPLLVDLLVGAVFLYLGERLVDGIYQLAVLGEGYAVLLACRDGFDYLEPPVALVGPVLGDW